MSQKKKRLQVCLCILFALSLPAHANESVISQLPPERSLRDLQQKVCQQPDNANELGERHASADFDIKQMRSKLRQELRVYMLEKSLELEKNIGFFYSHRIFPETYFPDKCPKINNEEWQSIKAKNRELESIKSHLKNTTNLRWKESVKTLLMASYELMFVRHILTKGRWHSPRTRNWQRVPFWPKGIEKIKLLSFPPIYPTNLAEMKFGHPQDRISYLYKSFPILRWRDMTHLGSRGQTIDHQIFELAFVNDLYDSILQRFEYDFSKKMKSLLDKGDESKNTIEAVRIKTAKNQELLLNPDQVRILRALQLYFISDFHRDIEQYVSEVSEKRLYAVARLIDKAYVKWTNSQKMVRDNACQGTDSSIEEHRSILWSMLNDYSKKDSLDMLSAFCHPSWSRTKARLLESGSQALYGLVFVAGILAKKIRPAAIPLASVMAAFSFLMRRNRGIHSLEIEKSLFMVSIREENNRIYDNFFNTAAIPVSFFGLHYASKAIVNAGAWEFFLPFYGWEKRINFHIAAGLVAGRFSDVKAHIDHGLNPLKTKNFFLNSFDNLLGALIGGHALDNGKHLLGRFKSTGLVSLTYALFNIYIQNLYFLYNRNNITIENHKFNNMWGMFHSTPRNVIDWSIFWNTHRGLEKSSGFLATAGWIALISGKLVDSYQKKTWYARSKVAYLKEDRNFFESYLDTNVEEYVDLEISKTALDDENDYLSLAEIKSLNELMRVYYNTDEELRLLIDIERFYKQAR